MDRLILDILRTSKVRWDDVNYVFRQETAGYYAPGSIGSYKGNLVAALQWESKGKYMFVMKKRLGCRAFTEYYENQRNRIRLYQLK